MNSRLDNSQDNAAITTILKLQADVTELKSRQSIGRALVKRSFLIQTANTFDMSAYSIPANTVHYFYIGFTGDGTQASPYGVQFSQIYNGGTDPAHRLSDYFIQDATGAYYSWYADSTYTGDNKMAWVLAITAGSSAASIYLKIRVMASCKATNLTLNY